MKKIRLLKLDTQEAIMVTIINEDDDFVYVDNASLVFAEMDNKTGGTKISYVPWVPFYKSQKNIAIKKEHIIVGLKEEVNEELVENYEKMVNPSAILAPKNKLII